MARCPLLLRLSVLPRQSGWDLSCLQITTAGRNKVRHAATTDLQAFPTADPPVANDGVVGDTATELEEGICAERDKP